MKVVINTCHGGFGLSHKATMRYAELKGITLYPYVTNYITRKLKPYKEGGERPFIINYYTAPQKGEGKNEEYWNKPNDRCDPHLIQVVEELKEEANGEYAQLKIVEIPDDVKWTIEE